MIAKRRLMAGLLLGIFVVGCGGGGNQYSSGPASTGSNTYYVDSAKGNDSNSTDQARSAATPWKTIGKALSKVGDGDTVLIADGTYAEDNTGNGFLWLNRTFNTPVLFAGANGQNSNVIVTGTTNSAREIGATAFAPCGNITFQYIKFQSRASNPPSSLFTIPDGSPSNLTFKNCAFTLASSASKVNYTINLTPTNGAAPSHLTFDTCTFNQTGNADADAFHILKATQGDPNVDALTITNCTITMQGSGGGIVEGVSNLTITNSTFTAQDSYGFTLGADGTVGQNNTGVTISGSTFTSAKGHALLIGAGTKDAAVSACTIHGGNQGLVIKDCANITADNCTVSGGTLNALYFKAASNCSATNCTVSNSGSGATCLRVGEGDTGIKSRNITVEHCQFTATNGAQAIFWADTIGDAGGGVCDYNTYVAKNGGTLGTIRGKTLTTLADLTAAWNGYGVANDTHSSL